MALYGVYTKLKTLAKDGGEAYIYKVRHNELGYVRALRVLKEPIDSDQDEKFLKFKEECKKLLRLGNGNHPNIVHIYQPRFWKDPNNDEGRAFVEMDYVDGMDLLKYLRQQQGFVPVDDVLRMVEQMSSALAFCHVEIYKFSMTKDEQDMTKTDETIAQLIRNYRVVHNDIHSNNIMRRENGDYVLLDFGLSFDGVEFVRTSRRRGGVQEFMAPEKWDEKLEDKDLTPQLDIYGFGVVMYEYLTGKLPFKFDGTTETQQLVLMNKIKASDDSREVVPSIFERRKSSFEAKYPGKDYSKKDYPDWLEEVIYKCLQKDPEKRYPDGKALYDDVMQHMKDENPLTKELKGLREQVETLKKSVDHLTAKLDKAENDKLKLKEEAEKEKAQLKEEAEEEIARLKAERDAFKGKLQEAETDIKKLEERIQELEKRGPILPPSGPEIAKLKEQLEQANNKIHELEQQLAEKLPIEEELKKQRNRFLKTAALVLAILLGAGGWFGWYGYKKISFTEQQLESRNDSLIRQERLFRRLQHDNEKQVKNQFLKSFHPKGEENSLVEGDYIGSVTNKNGSPIFLMEQMKGGVYHVMAYSFNEDSNRYEKTMAFNVPDKKGNRKDVAQIPSVSCECWKSSNPNGDFFVFNKADNTLYIPLMHEDNKTKQNFGSDRYIVYGYDGNRFTTKCKNEGGFWIHSSLRDYKALVAVLAAKNRLIRIDEMKDGSYRCAVWIDKVDMSGAPDLVLTGSLVETGQYLFEDDTYSYQIDLDSKTLRVIKNGKQKLFGSFDIEHTEVACKSN